MTIYIVFDDDGIIHSSEDQTAACDEFKTTEDFKGDLRLCKQLSIRR